MLDINRFHYRERNIREILDMMWGANRISIQDRIPQCPVE